MQMERCRGKIACVFGLHIYISAISSHANNNYKEIASTVTQNITTSTIMIHRYRNIPSQLGCPFLFIEKTELETLISKFYLY